MKLGEAASEEFVAGWLVENGGYDEVKGPRASRSSAFEPVWSIDTEDLFAFIGLTEADAWHRLVELHGSDPGEAQARVIQRPATESIGGAPSTCSATTSSTMKSRSAWPSSSRPTERAIAPEQRQSS